MKSDIAIVQGSPPRARGRERPTGSAPKSSRITPACAGKRWSRPDRYGLAPDHPRVRGEEGKSWLAVFTPWGSPPRARGRGIDQGHRLIAVGITPACAGKRPVTPALIPSSPDHPRVRGEELSKLTSSAGNGGSPPRARGRVHSGFIQVVHAGITPACAGKRGL